MTKREIAILACKVVAIIFFFRAIHDSFIDVNQITAGISTPEPIHAVLFSQNICGLLGNVLALLVCVWLWCKAETVATRFVCKSAPSNILLIDNNLAPSIIALAGIVIFTLAGSSFFGLLGHVLAPAFPEPPVGMSDIDKIWYMNPDEFVHIATAIIQMALGAGLFFGAHDISSRLRNRYQEKATS